MKEPPTKASEDDLLRLLIPHLSGVINRYVIRYRIDPQEALCDALLGLWKGVRTWKAEKGAWLDWCLRKALWKVKDGLRHRRELRRSCRLLSVDSEFWSYRQARCCLSNMEAEDSVNYILRPLPEKLRRLVCQIAIEEFTQDEIADNWGLSASAISRKYKGAIEELKLWRGLND